MRRELFEEMRTDTLLDDFILSLRLVMQGHAIAYCANAYAEMCIRDSRISVPLLRDSGKYVRHVSPCRVDGGVPVSYTHLDVYKRQGLERMWWVL